MKITKIIGFLLFVPLFLMGCSASKDNNKSSDLFSASKAIVDYSMSCLNRPYRYGAAGPSSFDCSGFTYFVFNKFGYHLPRNTHDQARKYPKIRRKLLKVGDLVFFEGRRKNGRIGHVGIVKKVRTNGSFDFVHASVSKGVTVSSSQERYYRRRYVKAARVLDDWGNIDSSSNSSKIIPSTKEDRGQIIYIVKRGDSLYKIARKHGCSITQLKEWNPELTNLILIGDKLLIHKKQ